VLRIALSRRKMIMDNLHAVKEPTGRSLGLLIAAVFTILAGFAEVVTGFTHAFFGITTANSLLFTYSAAVIGVFYAVSGFLILTMRKWAAVLAIVLLGADIVGRVALVLVGLYPTDSLKNTLSIIAGTLLVALVALYTAWKWKFFR
jgi:hypothetical protein